MMQQSLPRRGGLAIALAATLVLGGCALPARSPSLTIAQSTQTYVLGIPNARFMLEDERPLTNEFIASTEKEIEARRLGGQQGPMPPAVGLAISGGGDEGAFGAGLLVGWTAHGDRPSFKIVTGVSTGALTAPFAFLGPDYDPQLRRVYTEVNAKRIFKPRGKLAALFSDAMGDTRPLHDLVASYIDDHAVQRIAEEYGKGRLLLIMTTNLDAGRPCVWNIGAIAASGQPGTREFIVKVMLASAAIPAAFPPVLFDLDVNGQRLQEMHVDGGVIAQTFLYPPSIDVLGSAKIAGTSERQREAYIIRNSRLLANQEDVKRRTLPIATRAVSVMISMSGVNDIYRIYQITNRDHVGYHLAYIGDEFTEPYKGPFDPGYMAKLFQYGFERGQRGGDWSDKPPYLK
jgi:hypothetical protein